MTKATSFNPSKAPAKGRNKRLAQAPLEFPAPAALNLGIKDPRRHSFAIATTQAMTGVLNIRPLSGGSKLSENVLIATFEAVYRERQQPEALQQALLNQIRVRLCRAMTGFGRYLPFIDF
jgi:hypothetical protein